MHKILKTRESLLEKEQLKNLLAQIASSNTIINKSSISTFPIPRVKENYEYIFLVYKMLNDQLKMNIPIHPAGEWILDNFYLIEQSEKSVIKDLTKNKYKRLPGIKTNGFARIYILANEIVVNTDGKIEREELQEYLEAYQSQKYLTMEEIWDLGLFLQISIIEKIRKICEKIYISQTQKYLAQNIVERIIENKTKKKIKTKIEGKYAFIEYLSYKLRKLGEETLPYIQVLEEEVNKAGITIDEVIKREHFDIAIKTLSMKNCITSIKTLSRLDFSEVFDNVNITEKILRKDPAKVYEKMDYKTKSFYRESILELSKKTKLSEIFIANQIINICETKKKENEKQTKKTHIGFYLIDEGKKELLSKVLAKKINFISYKQKARKYIISIYFFSILITLLLIKPLKISALFLFVPIQNSITQIIQYIMNKKRKIRLIPKMDYSKGIPEESATMCIIPSILKNEYDVKKIFNKMEGYYLSNKSDNIYFTLLGDCIQSNKQNEKIDKRIIEKGQQLSKLLNEKYGEKFFFIYRKREWSDSEKCFMGWERKRGLIVQFNDLLLTGKSNFLVNTFREIPKIKYVITLDSDTNLVLNSAFQLVGAMSHILNKPEVDKIKNIVIKGHGIIQPHIGIDIEDGRKSIFSRLFAGNGGTDMYSNAVSDVYQDGFDEGIYTGKGIYDLQIFSQVLKNEIPEKTVLSHDLLEGNYLRCGLASDIVLMDGYPSKYNSYKLREHRWIRGDIQIIGWLKSKLNGLSKYKIIDNIVRNMNEKDVFLTYLILLLFMHKYITVPILVYSIPTIIRIIDNLINQKDGTVKHRLFCTNFSKWKQPLYKLVVDIMIIPDIAFLQLDAILKAMYRMKISHSSLLEWVTSSEAEEQSLDTYKSYFKNMLGETIIAVLMILYLLININRFSLLNQIIAIIISTLWSISSIVMWIISKVEKSHVILSDKEKEYLLDISKKTWKFFKDNFVNGLPIDNYQENRVEIKALRTSPTNIGLALLAIITSYDLKIERIEYAVAQIRETITSVEKLPKWNGHLYNWYNIQTLEPMIPLDISSVDNGNFVGYLYVTKQFLLECNSKVEVDDIIRNIDKLISETNFERLYNAENGLFSIGFNIEQNKLYDSYYDLLASESRQTSLIAIAKREVPVKHWNNLGRTLTKVGEHKGLVSWGGTSFEYLMPNINIPSYTSTLLNESCKLLVQCNKRISEKIGIPWGMSESAYSMKDLFGNYQYKTFGVQWLGLKRGLEESIVISPYSSALALNINPHESIQNLKKLEKEGLLGKYGFFESVDYKPKKEIIKTFMAHHQGMILASIDNVINTNILQKRFMKNPEIRGLKYLLQENMPENVVITRERKNKIEKISYKSIEKITPRDKGINIISNGILNNMVADNGQGYTKYKDKTIYNNLNIYIKNINSNKIFDINKMLEEKGENIKIEFKPSESKIIVEDGSIKAIIKTTIAPTSNVEVRNIKIENKGIEEIKVEVNTFMEPILQNEKDFKCHPAFNKMFLKYEYDESKIIVTRRPRSMSEEPLCLSTILYSAEGTLDFEIDKEKYTTRNYEEIPEAVIKSKQLSNSIDEVINPIVAFRKLVKIKPQEKKELTLISSIYTDKTNAEEKTNLYCDNEKIKRLFELKNEQEEAEARYLGINKKEVGLYQDMAKVLLYSNQKAFDNLKKEEYKLNKMDLSNDKLWRYGISGEDSLIVLKIKKQGDYDIVMEILKAYEYLISKNVKVEFIILTTKELKPYLVNERIEKYINVKGGIFVLEDLSYEESKIVELRASILLDSEKGDLKTQLKALKQKEVKKSSNTVSEYEQIKNKESQIINTDFKKLKYENGFGCYNSEKNEYWIKQSKQKRVPTAWCNIIANKNFGSVITENSGGFTWYINSQTNKLTKFDNDPYKDKSSERIIVKGYELGENDDYYTGFGFGYCHEIKTINQIEQKKTIFVPNDNSVKVSILQLKNNKNEEVKLDIKYEINFLMAQDENSSIIVDNYKKNLNMIMFNNLMNNKYTTYISSSEKIDNNMEVHVKLKAKEKREIIFVFGAEEKETKCIEVSTKYISSYIEEFRKTKEYWNNKVSKLKSNTPLKSLDIMQNGFLVYQTIVSRMLGRTGYYQSSGGYGFRDQLQDAMGMKWVDPDILKNQILLNARHQFYEGDVEHWWHEDSGLGIRTRYSDDLLWLVYAVEEYISFTGDYSILDEKESFINADELLENQSDRVEHYRLCTEKRSILEHCIKALKRATVLGEHNLPLIGDGDWNDGMNRIGEKGKGESVWLGFFLYKIIIEFIDILKYKEKNNHIYRTSKELEVEQKNNGIIDILPSSIEEYSEINYSEEIEKYNQIAMKLKRALNTTAWDGRWYARAFNDEGNVIGSVSSEECKIDSISQSFSVISNAGDNDKKIKAMESLENYLVDNENNLIRLLTPSLEKNNLGYISAYSKGMRENGGQYTHAAIWAIIAEAMLKRPDKVMDFYKKINPIEHTKTEEGVNKYRVEPYVIEADIYSEGKLAGRGGWTWYTGAAGWLYEAQIRYILGINIFHGRMKIKPCVPSDWKEFELDFKWKEAIYHIKYKQVGEYRINVEKDNEIVKVQNDEIELLNKGEYFVKVYF